MSTERVQKILAQAGIASRRKAEELIVEGAVTINGKVAKLGDKADLQADAIKVNGKLLRQTEAPIYLAFHKPRGVISMMVDPQGRPTLSDYLGKIRTRVFPVGRLDFNSEGLLLLTNDGKIAEEIQKRDDIPRVYHVKVRGHVTADMLARLERGMRIEGKKIKPHSVRLAEELNSKSKIEIVFIGSGAVDIKSYFEMKGFLTERMTRTAIGQITLRSIQAGHYRLLQKSQIEALLEQPELGLKRLEFENSKKKNEVLPRPFVDLRTKAEKEAKPILPISERPGASSDLSRAKIATAPRAAVKPSKRTSNRSAPRQESRSSSMKRSQASKLTQKKTFR